MTEHTFGGQLGRPVLVDVCQPCQTLWFDERENLQLSPGATLAVFRLIGDHIAKPAGAAADTVRCPRCRTRLKKTKDMQRATRFEYDRCPGGHGRLESFFDFLKEKDFVRPLTPAQIATLRQNIQMINCSNCGAPIDLAKGSNCPHCRSPLSMLDLTQAETLVAQLREADRTDKPVDPALPMALVRARREAEEAFKGLRQQENWLEQNIDLGLVGAGLTALVRMLKRIE
jgi:DNA-directed RNA polymerase subunit RPC12/RpoP